MLFRALAAAAILAAPASQMSPSITFPHYPMVHQVNCDEGRGTAFRVGGDHWLSVAHVTSLHGCEIDGNAITVTKQDGDHDFTELDAGKAAHGFPINCHGFIPGHWYWSVGYALGAPWQTAVAVYATWAKAPDGKRVLIGMHQFIPGMSGGPVLDSDGAVVGTVNAYVEGTPISLSREVKDTAVCGADIA